MPSVERTDLPRSGRAAASYRLVADRLPEALRRCASGQELIAVEFGDDVAVASELDADDVVPLLTADGFRAATR